MNDMDNDGGADKRHAVRQPAEKYYQQDKSIEDAAEVFEGHPEDASHGRLVELDKLVFIDVLRGWAIILVIWVHHGLSFTKLPIVVNFSSYGQMGVQLFFVASAFTLCLSWRARRSEHNPTRNFFVRRFFRIAPLYYVAIILYFFVNMGLERMGRPLGSNVYSAKNVILNIIFLHSFSSSAFNSIVPGGWSIGTEMVFYIIFPALFTLFSDSYHRFGTKACVVWLVVIVLLDSLVQVAINKIFDVKIGINNVIYCNIINQLPAFIVGISVYFLIVSGRFAYSSKASYLYFCVFTIISYSIFRGIGPFQVTTVTLSMLPLIGSISFAFLLNAMRLTCFNRVSLIMARVGQLSYSMYVFHFLFAWLATKIVVQFIGTSVGTQALLYMPTLLMSVVFSVGIAWISKQLIEDPFIDMGKRFIRRLETREGK